MRAFMHSFYTYLIKERLGYHRPARPIVAAMPDDEALRGAEAERLERLERHVKYLDANMDLIRLSREGRRQPS